MAGLTDILASIFSSTQPPVQGLSSADVAGSVLPPAALNGGAEAPGPSAGAPPAPSPDFLSALRGILSPGTDKPGPVIARDAVRAATADAAPAPALPQFAVQQQPQNSIVNMLRDIAVGASAGANPASPGGAFVKGMAGGFTAQEQRQQSEQAQRQKGEDTAFDRSMRTAQNQRAESAEGRANRSETFNQSLRTAQEKRAATTARFTNLKTAMDLIAKQNPQLSASNLIALHGNLTKIIQAAVNKDAPPEQIDRLTKEYWDSARKLGIKIPEGVGSATTPATPATPAAPPAPTAPAAPAVPSPPTEPPSQQPTGPVVSAPTVGQVVNGYRYRGGPPADPSSWELVQ